MSECNSVELTYYQRNRDVILNRAKDYYENDRETLRGQAREKYRNLSEEKKLKERIWKKKYTIICLKKKYKFFVRLKSVNIIIKKIVFQ